MKLALPLSLFGFGVVFAVAANGSLHLWPTVAVSAPALSAIVVSPVLSFSLLALALSIRPRFLYQPLIVGATSVLLLACLFVLVPSLKASESTDAQTGMFEALFAMATFPYSILAVVSSAIVQFAVWAKKR